MSVAVSFTAALEQSSDLRGMVDRLVAEHVELSELTVRRCVEHTWGFARSIDDDEPEMLRLLELVCRRQLSRVPETENARIYGVHRPSHDSHPSTAP